MILTTLLPHQVKAKAEIFDKLRKKGDCACFMFKGSGKSLVALSLANDCANFVLITSDKINVENTWPDQIDRHTSGWTYYVRPQTKTDWKALSADRLLLNTQHKVAVIVNYEFLTNKENFNRLLGMGFEFWIGDESSEFKDQRTHKHHSLARLVADIPFKLMLNGDPATEDLEDLFGQFKLLDGGKRLENSITKFRMRYMKPDRSGYKWEPKRGSLTQIQEYLRDISYWCHYDPEVKLPKPHYYCIKVPQTPEQKKLNDALMFTFSAQFSGEKIETNYAPVVFQKMVQLAGGVFRPTDPAPNEDELEDAKLVYPAWKKVPTNKLKVLESIVKQNPDAKIVVWHNYIPETELLYQHLHEWGLDWKVPLIIAVPPTLQEGLKKFRALKGGGVCLIRCSTCRGINELADADIAVFWSRPFSYARCSQAEGRTQRVSSTTEDTHIFDIITEGGADESVYRMIREKRSFSLTLPVLRSILNTQHMEGG